MVVLANLVLDQLVKDEVGDNSLDLGEVLPFQLLDAYPFLDRVQRHGVPKMANCVLDLAVVDSPLADVDHGDGQDIVLTL